MVLDVDPQKRRISLGLKQCMENPWEAFAENHKPGDELEGEIKNITEFGLFVGLPGDIDGMVHLSDLDWARSGDEAIADFEKGDVTKVKVLEIDVEKERISLGIKQLSEDPFEGRASVLKKGDVVTGTVRVVTDKGIEVDVDGAPGFIRRGDLARDRSEQRPDRFAVGEKVDAKIMSVDRASRKLTLSIKAREVAEEKEAMAQYGSSDSGASLGDILGAAISRANQKRGEDSGEPEGAEGADEAAASGAEDTAESEDKGETESGAADDSPEAAVEEPKASEPAAEAEAEDAAESAEENAEGETAEDGESAKGKKKKAPAKSAKTKEKK